MADLFGLAGQIASSVVKLKSYLDQIRDAPDDISILVDEIEDVHFLLSDIEEDQRRHPYSTILLDNTSASRCLDHCKRGVERLQRVVDEMVVEFENHNPMKRTWKASKIIWKRDRAEKYRAELASALRLMTLSHQIYTRSLIQLQPDIITSRITQLLQTESTHRVPTILQTEPTQGVTANAPISSSAVQVQDSRSSMRTDCTVKSCRPRRKQSAWFQWKFCSLLVGRAWDIEIYRSQQGWDSTISVYAYVSFDSLVARYAYNGNVEGLQRLFSRGEASPFTVCVEIYRSFTVKKSLLEIGASKGNFKLCEFLINEGADPKYVADDDSPMAPIDWFVENGARHVPFRSDSSNYSSYQLAGLLGAGSEITLSTLRSYRGPASVLSVLLNHMDTPIGELPIWQRRNFAINLARNARFNSPDLFLTALGYNPIPRAAITNESARAAGMTLLHVAAGAIGQLCYHVGWNIPEEFKRRSILGWKSIIHDLLAADANLHAVSSQRDSGFRFIECATTDDQITPLMLMFAAMFHNGARFYRFRQDLDNALCVWISTLYDYGVDLNGYGLRESSIWVNLGEPTDAETKYTGYTTRGTRDYDSDYYFGQRRLLGFNYGPFPEDWRVWINEPTDEFVGDFWLMVDRRVEVMPGTWTE